MAEFDLVEVGFVRKKHGFRGHLRLDVQDKFQRYVDHVPFIFLVVDGCYVPFKVSEVSQDRGTVVKFEDTDDPEQIKPLLGQAIFFERKYLDADISTIAADETGWEHLKDFTLIDQTSGMEGTIVEIEQYPGQVMAHVLLNSHTALVPLVEELIVEVSDEKRMLVVSLADGFFSL
ncbi:MAG: hypothetical protein KTR24_09395 [Saprospiraceae bacterium]|nr:hypothetical protein [Saprospiraceae bacterium]